MILYEVKKGDSLYSISKMFNVTTDQLINLNDIKDPSSLVVGESLIVKKSEGIYTVALGDSLYSIASKYGLNVNDIINLNPNIRPPYNISVGQKINVYRKTKIKINGYAYESSNLSLIEQSLPYLTYLSIFSYKLNNDGTLIDINDEPLINLAKRYRTSPLMVVTNTTKEGSFSSDLISNILNDPNKSNQLANDIINKMKVKGYRGINIDFEYVYPKDKIVFEAFIRNLYNKVKNEKNYVMLVALAPKKMANQQGILYESHDYNFIGKNTDYAVLMTYEWGYTYGPAMPVAPINLVTEVVNYALTEMGPNKIFLGVPNYGYDFTLPYVKGVAAKPITNANAINYIKSKNSSIEFDQKAQTPYSIYYDQDKKQHIIYFEDPRSMRAKALLAKNKNLAGISIWTVSSFYKQMFEVFSNYFEIEKM